MKYTVTRTTKRFVNGVLVEDTTVTDEADTPEQLHDPHEHPRTKDFLDRLHKWLDDMPRFK